jgi:hypothetical protein
MKAAAVAGQPPVNGNGRKVYFLLCDATVEELFGIFFLYWALPRC